MCSFGNGVKCNVEVQRADKDDHLRRVRFNASSITVKESNPGEKFRDVIELYVIYISEFDFFKGGKAIYHIDKILRETGIVVDDGLHEIFVNTAVDDGKDIHEKISSISAMRRMNCQRLKKGCSRRFKKDADFLLQD